MRSLQFDFGVKVYAFYLVWPLVFVCTYRNRLIWDYNLWLWNRNCIEFGPHFFFGVRLYSQPPWYIKRKKAKWKEERRKRYTKWNETREENTITNCTAIRSCGFCSNHQWSFTVLLFVVVVVVAFWLIVIQYRNRIEMFGDKLKIALECFLQLAAIRNWCIIREIIYCSVCLAASLFGVQLRAGNSIYIVLTIAATATEKLSVQQLIG